MKAKLLLLAVLTLALTGCGSGHAHALRSARPAPNVLVYAKAPPSPDWSSGTENVWRANIDGRRPKLIAKDSYDPAVSPDGRSIAYDKGGNVLVVPAAGGEPRIVYRQGAYPTWAPDSRHLAVYGGAGLEVILDVRTGTKRAIAGYASSSIAFSPDSTRVVYGVEDQTGSDLYVAPIDGGRPVQITDDHKSFGPVWGPKGIAFIRFTQGSRSDIWLTGPRPNAAHRLTHMGNYIWPIAFSRDGRELLAAYSATDGERLWAVSLPRGRARPIITPALGTLYAQGLSADGRTVLAVVGCGGDYAGPHHGYIATIPVSGGKPRIVTRGPCSASWNAGY